jgi:fibronectin-binding autotransporter adhesin
MIPLPLRHPGTSPLIKSGNGCLVLSEKNSYTGPTIINSGTIRFLTMISGGKPSSIGSSSSDAANIVIKGGNL